MVGKRQVTTMCPMNCLPTQCGMTVEVEGNRLLSLKGDQDNPDCHLQPAWPLLSNPETRPQKIAGFYGHMLY